MVTGQSVLHVPPFLSQLDHMRLTRQHPHAGALFPDGVTPGNLHNRITSFLIPRQSDIDWNYSLHPSKNSSYIGLDGLKMVQKGLKERQGSKNNDVKLFCAVYTYSAKHYNNAAISKTWARQCDGFLVSSNFSDIAIGVVKQNIKICGKKSEVHLHIFMTIISKIMIIFTYVVVENLHSYLVNAQVLAPLNRHLDIISQKNSQANNNLTWDHFYDTNETILELFKEWRTLNKEIPCPLLLGYPMDKKCCWKEILPCVSCWRSWIYSQQELTKISC
jgi:hypothetical protein